MRYRVEGVVIVHRWGTDVQINAGPTYIKAKSEQQAKDRVMDTTKRRAAAEDARWGWCKVEEA